MRSGRFHWIRWFRISWRGLREVAAFVSAITVLAAAVVWLAQQWRDHQDWRPAENARLAALRSTHLMTKVHDVFGAPLERFAGPQHVEREYFHHHNYWLQVTYDGRTNNVLAWTVTTCNDSFRPGFSLAEARVQIGRSTLHDVESVGILDAKARFWHADTIHQPNQLIEFGRLPGVFSFVGLVWGVTDICGFDFPQPGDVIDANSPESFHYEGSIDDCNTCTKITRQVRINTYGEIYDGRELSWFYAKGGLATPRFVAAGPFFAVG